MRDPLLRRQRSAAWRADLARLLPELGPPPPGEDPARLFEAVATLLAFLSRRLRDQPIVFVITVREENLADAAGLRSLLRDLDAERSTVALSRSQPETAALVRALAPLAEPTAVGRLVEQIWQVSEGNPLMVVETMRAVEQGLPSATSGGLPVVERVRDLILGRLERVTERGRHLLDFAAAIGRDFTFPLLQRAAGLGEAAAAAGVEELVRRHVLRLAGDSFQFTHDRIREVVYAEVFPPRRRVLHRRVAAALEALHAADLAAVEDALALHYRAAEVWDRARAGARAEEAQAMDDAMGTADWRPRVDEIRTLKA